MSPEESQDKVTEAKNLYAKAKNAWGEVYEEAANDLYFLSDVPGAQWDLKAFNSRIMRGRPALTLDQLDKYCNQVVNDEKMATPTIKFTPDSGETAKEDAEIFQGIVRNIEYQSEAEVAYDTGAEFAVKCSIGFIDVDHEFEDDGFLQRMTIRRVVNPLSRYIDPDSVKIDGSDAMWGFRLDEITVKEFKKLWPEQDAVSFSDDPHIKPSTQDDDTVMIAELFQIEETEEKIGLLEGNVIEPVQDGVQYLQTRKIPKRTVRRYKLSGQDVLEESTFPGKYIPIVPVYGKEMWRDGKRFLHSLIRKAKPAQQLFNMWKSTEAEILMRRPRSNFMAPAQSVTKYANDWKNPENVAVLMYDHKDVDSQPLPPPTMLPPPQFPEGLEIAAQGAVQSIKDAMGIYDASLGMRSNETSGVAIQRRQQEGDVATFHFPDNRVKSITQVGRILQFAIPEVYDTPRVIQMIDGEENAKPIGINGALAEKQEQTFDIQRGKYTLKVVTGASFTTRRQEAHDLMMNAIQADPSLMKIFGDLFFETMDMAGAQEIANRIKKTMPPELVGDNDEDPVVLALQQQLQQAQMALQALQAQLQAANKESQQKDAEIALKAKEIDNDAKIEAAKLLLQEQEMGLEAQVKSVDLQEKQIELQIKQMELEIKRIEAESKLAAAQISAHTAQMNAVHQEQSHQQQMNQKVIATKPQEEV